VTKEAKIKQPGSIVSEIKKRVVCVLRGVDFSYFIALIIGW
jgi:hypothetical protein